MTTKTITCDLRGTDIHTVTAPASLTAWNLPKGREHRIFDICLACYDRILELRKQPAETAG
jgi:hypothetical protein